MTMISIYSVPDHPDGPKWRVVVDAIDVGTHTAFFDNHEQALSFVQNWLNPTVPM